MTFVREIARRCAQAGVRVIYVPGCERRGNGQSWARWPEGIVDHHTGGGNNIYVDRILIDGRRDLSGPLCNFATLYDGDLALVAEYPANHAGASGGWDTWPLPVTRVFNRQTVGNEIQYRGTEPMSPAQWATILVLNRVTMQVLAEIGAGVLSRNGDPIRIKFHQGTSRTGKWDPGYAPGKTYDIGHFRRTVGRQPQEDDMASVPQAQWDRVYHELTTRFPSRVEGSNYADTMLGYSVNADAHSWRGVKRIDETARAILARWETEDARHEALMARLEALEERLNGPAAT